ncbi:MAG: FAD-dependent oxidoreductase, partial [Bacilli bacterium]
MKKVIIVGGVAGGASTAARLRRLDENCEIIMLERGEYISFANCGLPYYIGGVIKDRDKLLVQTPEAMKKRFNIDVRTQNEVLSINKEARTIEILDIKTNKKYEEKYDALVLSTGSSPLKPNIKGIEAENIKTLWTIPDTDAIVNYINENNVKSATVVGGGFIGLEMVENLRELGIQVTLAEMAPQVMAPLDFEMAQYVHEELVNQGVKIYLNNGVDHFETRHGVTTTYLKDGTPLESDLVILSLGIIPNSKLAKDAGLELNKRGYVVVDKHMTTSDKAIYAVGDVTEITDYNTKEKTNVALAGPANKEGRVCADNIAGIKSEYVGSQKTSVAKVFDLTVSTTGQNEKDLQKSGKVYKKDYLVSYIEPKSHAGYYPNAFPMHMKLVFNLDGKVLGAQNVGYEGVEKRIDVISTLMHYNGTIKDMTELDLSYAPPFGSAKDPVNMIGFAS